MVLELVIPAVVSAVAALMAFVASRKQKADTEKQKDRLNKINEALRTSLSESSDNFFDKYHSQSIDDYRTNDYYSYINNLRNFLVHYQGLETKADIKEQVNASVNELKKRIEAIETRFPQEATLEKIASVNDAILATQLETMSKSINAIQEKMLTKWDVAKTVFAIVGALGGIVAIIFAILVFVQKP